MILAGTQSLLVDDFGGSTKLRGFLSDRNCFVYRNPNKTEQHVVAGLKIAPSALPVGGGYAFAVGAGRVSMLRGAWSPDMSPHLAGLPQTLLDPDCARVMDRHRPAEAGDPVVLYAEAAAKLRQLRTGWPAQPGPGAARSAGPDQLTRGPDHANHGPDQRRTGPDQALLGGVHIPAPLSAANVIPMHRDRPGPDQPDSQAGRGTAGPDQAGQDALGPDLTALSGAQRTVYDALTSLGTRQTARNAQLVDLTGLSGSVVSKALTALAEFGLARKLGHGAWAPTRHASVTCGNGGDVDVEESG